MESVLQKPLPDDALLKTYRGGRHSERWEGYGDCFVLPLDRTVSLAEFVFAFYTAPLFRIERVILRWLAASPSTDEEARQLVAGQRDSFAAWRLEARTDTQLLMGDRFGRTRSWFRVLPQDAGGTLLHFGSAVAATPGADGSLRMGSSFGLLLGFHRLYSRMLLRSAKRQLLRRVP